MGNSVTFNDTSFPSSFCSLEPNWWLFALRGILTLLFGIFMVLMPGAAMLAVTIVFGAYALVDGIFLLIAGINQTPKGRHWGSLVVSGVLSIIIGLIVLIMPQAATIGLVAFLWAMLATWSILTGILQIVAAIRLRKEIKGEWLLGLAGILSFLLGAGLIVLFWVNPVASFFALALLIGINSIFSGLILLLLAFKLRKRQKMYPPHRTATQLV